MRIGIDARALQGETQYRGIGKALESLLTALVGLLDEDDTCVFYVDAALKRPEVLDLFPQSKIIKVKSSSLGRKRYIRSVLPAFPSVKPLKKDVDVLLQYDASLGVPTNVPAIVAFHDLIPYLFRSQEKKMNVQGLRKMKNSLASSLYWRKYLSFLNQYKKAARILAISESSKKDLLKFSKDINSQDVHVVYLGASKSPEVSEAPSQAINKILARPYLLYVGGIDLRKNIVGLLKTFYELKTDYPDLRLVTVGKEFSLADQLQDLGWTTILNSDPQYNHDVIAPGYISDSDRRHLYIHAAAFVFPSRYEGFGLPPIEAMQAGCPVIAYDNSSIPEVVGEAAILVKDGEPLAQAVRQLLGSKKLRNELIKKGRVQAKKFTWEKTARETLKQLRAITK